MDLVKKMILSQKHSANALSTSICTSPTEGHPDSGLYNLVPFPLTHTHKLKTLSASSVVPYLTTDNKKNSVFQPFGSGCKGKPLI